MGIQYGSGIASNTLAYLASPETIANETPSAEFLPVLGNLSNELVAICVELIEANAELNFTSE